MEWQKPALVDLDFEGSIDCIYAGDLYGNLHGFDVSGFSAASWSAMYAGKPFFTAPQDDTYQPSITSRPVVIKSPLSPEDIMIFIGTGRNLEQADRFESAHNSLYGLIDKGNAIQAGKLKQVSLESAGEAWQLQSSVDPSDLNDQYLGWALKLPMAQRGLAAHRAPVYQFGELTWLLTEYSSARCEMPVGNSHIISMNPITGASLNRKLFSDDAGKAITNGDKTC